MPLRTNIHTYSSGVIPFFSSYTSSKYKLQQKSAIYRTMHQRLAPLHQHETTNIKNFTHCLYGQDSDFSQQKTVILAHFDIQGIVDPHVKHQCMCFQELGYKVILVSGSPLAYAQNEKDNPCADACLYRNCQGYDFTSWKAALHFFPSLYNCPELILTNDSYFGPLWSLKKIHAHMQRFHCDFWGMTSSVQVLPHLQSYYLVLKAQVLQHTALKDFFSLVPLSSARRDAINLELSFTAWLSQAGFVPAAAANILGGSIKHMAKINPTLHGHKDILAFSNASFKGVPLFKKEALRSPDGYATFLDYAEQHKYSYPFDYIDKFFLRIRSGLAPERGREKQYPAFPPDVLSLYKDVHEYFFRYQKSENTYKLSKKNKEHTPFAVYIHASSVHALKELSPYLAYVPRYAHIYVITEHEHFIQAHKDLLAPYAFAQVMVQEGLRKSMAALLLNICDTLENYKHALILKASPMHINKTIDAKWRHSLYDNLLGSQERVAASIALLREDMEIGILAPPCYPPFLRAQQGSEHALMREFLHVMHIDLAPDVAIDYPLGGMFWCQPNILNPWKKLGLTKEHFARFAIGIMDERKANAPCLALALEKLLFFGCGLQKEKGKKWARLPLR